MNKKYNLYIVDIHAKETNIAMACIGRDLTERQAGRRMIAALCQINSNCFVDTVEVTEDRYTVARLNN